MSDIAVVYTLTTSGGTIHFNKGINTGSLDVPGQDDFLWITAIHGIDGVPMRTPVDNRPQAHGGLAFNFWQTARPVVIEGVFLVQSSRLDSECQRIRNVMDIALLRALESIIQSTGTLQWTPSGQASRTLDVKYHVQLETDGVEQKIFTFGLIAPTPAWY